MDTLLLIPFQMWGVSPYLSRNISPIFQRPHFQNIPIRNTDDLGILIRRGFVPLRDTIPLSHLYSLQISDTFYLIGGSLEKPLIERKDSSSPARLRGVIQGYYDYAGRFKQATLVSTMGKWIGGFINAYKKGASLSMLFIQSERSGFTIQKMDSLWSMGILLPYLKVWLVKNRYELRPTIPFEFHSISGEGGLYVSKGVLLPHYSLRVALGRIEAFSRYNPFYFEKQNLLVKEHTHGLSISTKNLLLSLNYGHRLIPQDTTVWIEREVLEGHLRIDLSNARLEISRFINSPIELIGRLKIWREFHPWRHVKLIPYAEALYMENQFESMDIEDIFHLSMGIRGVFYGAVDMDVSYEGNAGIESLWEGNFYKIFIWIDLED